MLLTIPVIALAASVVISPDPQAIGPVARPLCLMNVGPSTVVYAGDVKEVRLSADRTTVQLLSTGGKLDTIAVPADQDATEFRTAVAVNVRSTWSRCLGAK